MRAPQRSVLPQSVTPVRWDRFTGGSACTSRRLPRARRKSTVSFGHITQHNEVHARFACEDNGSLAIRGLRRFPRAATGNRTAPSGTKRVVAVVLGLRRDATFHHGIGALVFAVFIPSYQSLL